MWKVLNMVPVSMFIIIQRLDNLHHKCYLVLIKYTCIEYIVLHNKPVQTWALQYKAKAKLEVCRTKTADL